MELKDEDYRHEVYDNTHHWIILDGIERFSIGVSPTKGTFR